MNPLRASFMIALTLIASLPICCCTLGASEKVPSCCHSQPTQEKMPCDCDDQADPIEAKFAFEVLPAPVLKLADPYFFSETTAELRYLNAPPYSKFGHSNSPPSRHIPALSALEHCAVLAVYIV